MSVCVCVVGDSNGMTADVTKLQRKAKTGRMEFLALRLEVCTLSYRGVGWKGMRASEG